MSVAKHFRARLECYTSFVARNQAVVHVIAVDPLGMINQLRSGTMP